MVRKTNTLPLLLLFLFVVAAASVVLADAQGCFPMSQGWGSGPAQGQSRDSWWCGVDEIYGFLGFSYPVEDDYCPDYSYDSFKNDFQKMKDNYNATFVRLYLPVCRETSFWVEMVKAARDTSVGLIPMVFWDWQENDPIMTSAENALMGVFTDPTVGSIAPYIIHSVAFGDELGEQGNYWVPDMQSFKTKLAQYGIPISISDDWDRSVYTNGGSLSSFGQKINDLGDLTQAHVQPYYHPDVVVNAYDMWPYFQDQLNFLVNNNKRPIIVSQTMWAYNEDGHQRGSNDAGDNMQNYQEYWNTINQQCQTFKNLKVGYFFHTWYGEPGFDLIDDNGNPVYDWTPTFC